MEWVKQNIALLTSIATAAWAILTWTYLRIGERNKEQKRIAALYVNPFMLACEELQSRLYNILQQRGLYTLKTRHPDGSYAEETLYLILRYFGWERCVYRYGPYTRDARVIEHTVRIRHDFAADEYGVKAFCFFRPEQRALGQLIMRRSAGEFGQEFETVSFYEFRSEEILGAPPFSDTDAIKETLTALKKLRNPAESFDGLEESDRKRLVKIQNHLVSLLEYLEKKEGFSLSLRKRLRATETPPPGVSRPAAEGENPPTG